MPRRRQVRQGLTIADYDRMLVAQEGVCGICRNLPGPRRMAVDHCHKCGQIRGLLCFQCNRYVLGRLTLAKAKNVVRYLEMYGCQEETTAQPSQQPIFSTSVVSTLARKATSKSSTSSALSARKKTKT